MPRIMQEQSFPLSIQASILLGALIIAVAILINGGVIKLAGVAPNQGSGASASAAPAASPQRYNVGVGSLPILGDNSAKVAVIEFADYQCPFCEKFFTDTQPPLKKDYIDTGKVKFAFRDFAFLGQPTSDPAGDESTNAANAARCANEQGKFWDYHDYLYSHQGQEDQGTFSKDNLKKFAQTVGLNTDQFNSCVDSDKHVKEVSDDKTAGGQVGVTGTPTTFINGKSISGACPYSTFDSAIKAELAGKSWSVTNCQIGS